MYGLADGSFLEGQDVQKHNTANFWKVLYCIDM